MINSIGSVVILTSLLMAILWTVQKKKAEADIVDAGWSASLGLAAIFISMTGSAPEFRRFVTSAVAGLWSIRLTYYLYTHRVAVSGEDTRYKELRARWGKNAQSRFFWFFQAQAVLVGLLSVSYYVAANNPAPSPTPFDVFAVILFLIALIGESWADRQLASFKANPENRGKTCRQGLWRYSRHPNYFFEWLHWWSYVLLSVGSHYLVLTLIAPILMLFFLLKVTGIPPIERRAERSGRADWPDYVRTTNAFFPWFPKK